MARHRTYSVILTDDDVALLKSVLRKRTTSETVAARCRILLAMDENHPPIMKHSECATAYGISMATVANIVKQYCAEGLANTITLKRSANSDQARRKIDGRAEAMIVATACGPTPDGRARWTVRLLESSMRVVLETPVSRETIRRTLKKTNCALTDRTTGACLRRRTPTS